MSDSASRTTDDLADLRRRLLRNLVLLSVLTSGAILGVTMILTARARESVSKLLLERANDKAESELGAFFGGVTRSLLMARDWGESGALAIDDVDALNERFVPLVVRSPQISSLNLGDERGRGYLLLHTADEWLNRITDIEARGRRKLFRRWSATGGPVATEERALDYDPRTQSWFEGAMAAQPAGGVHWTDPETFFTTREPGMTASVRYRAPGDSAVWQVIAFDVLLTDVSRFTRELEVSPRGKIVVLDTAGRVVGLPKDERFQTLDDLDGSVLKHTSQLGVAPIADACRAWEEQERSEWNDVWAFESGGERWWCGARTFDLGPVNQLIIAAVVPESDLLSELAGQRRIIIALAVLALLASIGLAVVLNRAFKRRVDTAVSRARKLGQYTLGRLIGRGGMGAVYHARHAMLRRPTAIKLLNTEQAGSELALRRFEREVQQTARMTHPNTIAIYDYGRTPEGVFYYAMEYLNGVSLEDLVHITGRLPAARVVHVLAQICGSLAEAHDAGLVHRDIKPANIMLCERGGVHDVVKVLDFGLVKSTDGTGSMADDVGATREGTVAGTPRYLAPECIRAPDTVDARSDLYAVGAVGYFLVTGKNVFEGDTIGALIAAQLTETPVRPSVRIGEQLPRDLEDAILACLAKDPDDRPPSARALADAITACVDCGAWTRADAGAWWTEHAAAIEEHVRRREGAGGEAPGPMTIDLGSRRGTLGGDSARADPP